MNNSVPGGFLCWQCRNVFDSMWGTTCNNCRALNEQTEELKKIRKELEKQNNGKN